jgi:glycosyltransferase 2 family protein
VSLIISLIVGIALMVIIFWHFGLDSLKIIYHNLNYKYLLIYFFLTTTIFFANAKRLQIILRAHKEKISLLRLTKQNIAGFAMAYVTPSVKLGGEPIKAYMLKKECNVGFRTGSSAIILDKFVEIIGTIFVGLIGLIILILMPGIHSKIKWILTIITVGGSIILYYFYYRTIQKKGSFSSLYKLLKFYKITKWKSLLKVLKDVELKMHKFFVFNQKEFLLSFIFYIVYFILNIIEFKFLFLSFGVDLSVVEIILTIVVLGLVNFIPTPAALGFFEASQSGLFKLLKESAGVGLAFSIIVRVRNIFFTAIGFAIISHFSGKQIIEKNGNTEK